MARRILAALCAAVSLICCLPAVAEAMDSTMKDFRRIHGAFKSLEALVNSLEEEHTTPRTRVTVKEKNIDPLDAFLKANGLKN